MFIVSACKFEGLCCPGQHCVQNFDIYLIFAVNFSVVTSRMKLIFFTMTFPVFAKHIFSKDKGGILLANVCAHKYYHNFLQGNQVLILIFDID